MPEFCQELADLVNLENAALVKKDGDSDRVPSADVIYIVRYLAGLGDSDFEPVDPRS